MTDFERKCYAVSFRCLNEGSANLSVTQACVLILSLSSHQTTRYLTTSGWHPSSSGSVHKSCSAHSHTKTICRFWDQIPQVSCWILLTAVDTVVSQSPRQATVGRRHSPSVGRAPHPGTGGRSAESRRTPRHFGEKNTVSTFPVATILFFESFKEHNAASSLFVSSHVKSHVKIKICKSQYLQSKLVCPESLSFLISVICETMSPSLARDPLTKVFQITCAPWFPTSCRTKFQQNLIVADKNCPRLAKSAFTWMTIQNVRTKDSQQLHLNHHRLTTWTHLNCVPGISQNFTEHRCWKRCSPWRTALWRWCSYQSGFQSRTETATQATRLSSSGRLQHWLKCWKIFKCLD